MEHTDSRGPVIIMVFSLMISNMYLLLRFVDVVEKRYKIPVGRWMQDKRWKELGRWKQEDVKEMTLKSGDSMN